MERRTLSKNPIRNDETRKEIANQLWPLLAGKNSETNSTECYALLAYYDNQCRTLSHTVLLNDHDVLRAISELRVAPTKAILETVLRSMEFNAHLEIEDHILEDTIILLVRLLLMIEVNIPFFGFSGRPPLMWDKGNLQALLQTHFAEPPLWPDKGIKLEAIFNARDIQRLAGIKIEFTSNLLDHLLVREDANGKSTVAIFHHATFLRRHQSGFLPDGLAKETLDTLRLLFPSNNKKISAWYHKMSQSAPHVLDRQAVEVGQLRGTERQIQNFKFWHDRLVILKQEFDYSSRRSLWSCWLDTRDRVQWCFFWVAVFTICLTLFFGMIGSILAAWQIYLMYHPLKN